MMDHADLVKALIPVAHEAGNAIMAIHDRGVSPDTKSDGSPVTEADKAAELIILDALAELAAQAESVAAEVEEKAAG